MTQADNGCNGKVDARRVASCVGARGDEARASCWRRAVQLRHRDDADNLTRDSPAPSYEAYNIRNFDWRRRRYQRLSKFEFVLAGVVDVCNRQDRSSIVVFSQVLCAHVPSWVVRRRNNITLRGGERWSKSISGLNHYSFSSGEAETAVCHSFRGSRPSTIQWHRLENKKVSSWCFPGDAQCSVVESCNQ